MAKYYILCKLCYENSPPHHHRAADSGGKCIFSANIFANVLKYGRIVYVGLPSPRSNSRDCPGTRDRLVTHAGGETVQHLAGVNETAGTTDKTNCVRMWIMFGV